MLDLPKLMTDLACHRPIFHSEADFQHALAWQIHVRHPGVKLRLEYRPAFLPNKMYLDIWAAFPDDSVIAIELKYKTKAFVADYAGESFRLVDQSAPDQGRYDFVRDISRLETITAAAPAVRGAAVFLSNESTYWAAPRPGSTVDAAFRIHEGRALVGELAWGAGASAGTMKSRESPIRLSDSYNAA